MPTPTSDLQLRRVNKAFGKSQVKVVHRRNRLNAETKAALHREYNKMKRLNIPWTKYNCRKVATKVGMSEAQVYKWGWDQGRRDK